MGDTTTMTRSLFGSFFSGLLGMPGWHKAVLVLSALLLGAGGVGELVGALGGGEKGGSVATTAAPGASSAVSGSESGDRSVAHEQTFIEKHSPAAMRIGVSVLVAFVIGWLFRKFIKAMALITLVIGGTFAALTYFKVINVDLSSAQGHYETAMEWLHDQAGRIKEMVVAYLPSNVGKVLGFYLGFRRHKS